MCRFYLNIVLLGSIAVFLGGVNGSNTTENVTVTENVTAEDNVTVTDNVTETTISVTEFGSNVTAGYKNETSVNETTIEEIVTTTLVPNVIFSKESPLELCTCDVSPVSCDINCCCDRDCSAGDRRAFTECDAGDNYIQESFDSRYCFKKSQFYRINTPYKMIETLNELFCIYKDNYPQRFHYNDLSVITDAVAFDNILKEQDDDHWPFFEKSEGGFFDETLKVGSSVYIKYPGGTAGYLVLPRSLTSGMCNTKNPMSYMRDQTFSCYQYYDKQSDCTTNRWLNGNSYYEHFKVAKTSASFKIKSGSNSSELKNFLEVTPLLCVETFQGANKFCNYTDIKAPHYENGTCYDAVSKAIYVIEHNGTEGLLNVEVHLTLGDMNTTSNNIWMQEHGVSFRWPSENTTEDIPFRRSGNPGYLMGAPVIAGKLVKQEKTAAVRLDPDPRTWLTVMMPSASGNGQCIWENGSMSSEFNRVPIGFGHDLRTGCLLIVPLKNLTNICEVIQSAALNALHGFDPPDVVASYGNSLVENLGEWVPILRESQPSVKRSRYEDFSCTNIVRVLNIHILYANIGAHSNPQRKIIGVRLLYGNADRLKISCTGYYCMQGSEELTQRFTVTTTVSFVDLSEPAVPIYAEPPSLDIHLPYDFFYPFHESNNATNLKFSHILCILILLINLILLMTRFSVF